MELTESVADFLDGDDEIYNYNVYEGYDGSMRLEIEVYTPAGEDWIEEFWYDGTLEALGREFYDRWQSFDVDEEVMLWVGSLGANGVPSTIRELLEDAEWKEDKLMRLADAAKSLAKAT